ncbi:MAG: hypothetical protein KKE76_02755 [Gammaproteobacteria bacterium]|nr:hypothetical protein [Gammaproteobacteria bacterium]
MSDPSAMQSPPQQISARSARFSASLFNYGNVIAMIPGLLLAPYILWAHPTGTSTVLLFVLMIVPPILWFGASIVVYALARHHPDPQVGHCTQQAAYRFYGMFGLVIPVGTFYGTDWRLWIITGGIVALILIPWSVLELRRIARLPWRDITLNEETHT